jgi:hypothetical protein
MVHVIEARKVRGLVPRIITDPAKYNGALLTVAERRNVTQRTKALKRQAIRNPSKSSRGCARRLLSKSSLRPYCK